MIIFNISEDKLIKNDGKNMYFVVFPFEDNALKTI